MTDDYAVDQPTSKDENTQLVPSKEKMPWIEKFKENLSTFKLIILICLFGTGSWVEINGIWVELPLLVKQSPQSWSLPSYLTVVIQIANIGPILYYLLNKYVTHKGRKVITEIPVIYIILAVGVISSVLLAFLWERTTSINGTLYSTALITLSFFLATVDCTSSLTFLPFMAYFPAKFMTAYYIGEGMSGLLPSLAALIQGLGGQSYHCESKTTLKNFTLSPGVVTLKNVTEMAPSYFYTEPRFTTRAFFLFVAVMMLISLCSFAWLVRIKRRNESKSQNSFSMKNVHVVDDVNIEKISKNDVASVTPVNNSLKIKKSQLALLLILNGLINGLSNGVLPSLQSYACLPYSDNIYHYTLVFSSIANPLACFLYFFVSLKSTMGICIGVLVYLLSAGYTIGIAASSPCPLLNNSEAGGIIVLLVTVLGVGLVNYLKTAISTVLRQYGYKVLFWCGISVQIGSLIGALITFPMVNVYGLFKQSAPCQQCG